MSDLRRGLTQAMRGQAGLKVMAPRVTRAQVERGEALVHKILSGAPVIMVGGDDEIAYEANALPPASEPAWTETQAGDATATVADSILSLQDTG